MSRMLTIPTNMTALLRTAIEIVLVGLLVFVSLRAFLSLNASDTGQGQDVSVTVSDQPDLSDDTPIDGDYSVLIADNPFLGQVEGPLIDNAAALNAPETSLNLTLKGVRATGDGKGVAYILLPAGQQVLAKVGTEILDDVEVEYVFEDRVTLRTLEGLETLYWRDRDSRAVVVARAVEAPEEDDQDGRLVLYGNDVSAKKFISDVSLVLVEENGVPVGYRVIPERRSGALQAAGFQAGDIILEVNEFPVSEIDVEDLQDLLQAATVFEFYIERGEKTERVSVEFAQGVEN